MTTFDYGPENFPKSFSPSLIVFRSNLEREVADADIRGEWVFIRTWEGKREYIPAHRIRRIQRLETEYINDSEERANGASYNRRLADVDPSNEDTEIIQ